MTRISTSGNLAALPELRTSSNGNEYARARVIQNFRDKDRDTGQWADTATVAWDLTVVGRRARQLVEAATVNGNIGIAFEGRLQIRGFTREDGSAGIAYEVMADSWSILPGQNVMIAKPPTPATT